MIPFWHYPAKSTYKRDLLQVGGLLGLFMGFSFVSGVEIVYHGVKIITNRVLVIDDDGEGDKLGFGVTTTSWSAHEKPLSLRKES